MRVANNALAILAPLILVACGNHSSVPVVYGADGQHQARIYSSRDEIYQKQKVEQQRIAQSEIAARRAQPASASSVRRNGVALTPVSAVHLSNDVAPGTIETKKVRGFIEVQPGDTVYAVARRFSVSPKEIIARNDLRAPYNLRVGQVLKLPRGAEVVEASAVRRQVVARDTLYAVRRGDTLYSISKKANVAVGDIARANAMRQPYTLSIGQQILIPQARTNSAVFAQSQPARTRPNPSKIANATVAPRDVGDIARSASYTPPSQMNSNSQFNWPVKGAIIATYGSGDLGRRNDGVNIAAPAGTPVRAAAAGEVVYRGSELDGFGNLLLVKHSEGYVTAYAHNDAMLVKKGDRVRKGQVIAKVGDSGAVTSPQLHFEIRQNLKSIDPLALLGSQ